MDDKDKIKYQARMLKFLRGKVSAVVMAEAEAYAKGDKIAEEPTDGTLPEKCQQCRKKPPCPKCSRNPDGAVGATDQFSRKAPGLPYDYQRIAASVIAKAHLPEDSTNSLSSTQQPSESNPMSDKEHTT